MDSAPEFYPYRLPHLTVICLTIALPFALAALVRSSKSHRVERMIVSTISVILLLDYVTYLALIRRTAVVAWQQLLPLQLCDWGMVVVIVAMWTGRQRWFEVAYFWGIGGTVQAVLTPNLHYGFPDFRFFSFFISHCGIIVGVVFLMLTRHYRPLPMSIVRVFLWSELYFLVTFIADAVTGYNYGFLLHKPEAFSILNFLSDSRPLYLLQMHGLALLFFIVLYAPFAIVDLARGKSPRNAGKQEASI
ncbi:MAG TPA: TIGR02206 family membrane protein [Chthoniobacterales bacterium]|nr:TIGR02206 family membrane protein [Chthoniobacterales bacterium]